MIPETIKVQRLTSKGDPPVPRYHPTLAYYNDSLFMFGGIGYAHIRTFEDLFEYHIPSNTWTKLELPNAPSKREGHTCVQDEEKMIIFGGYHSGVVFYDTYFFNFRERKWYKSKNYNAKENSIGRWIHSAVLYKNLMIIYGGYGAREILGDVHAFDISSEYWFEIKTNGDVPANRNTHTAVVYKDEMYIMGGFTSIQSVTSSIYSLNLITNRWKRINCSGNIPAPRRGHATILYGYHFIIFGGKGDKIFNDLYCFNLETKEWKELKVIGEISPLWYPGSVLGKEGMYIFGGSSHTVSFNDLYLFSLPYLDKRDFNGLLLNALKMHKFVDVTFE